MTTNGFGDTVLEREFEATDVDGNKSIIKLRIGIPYFKADSTSNLKWRCAYQITGIGSDTTKLAPGMDAIDAMLMCVQLANVWMNSYRKDTQITWLGEDWLGLTFPSAPELTEEDRKTIFEDENNPFKIAFDEFFRNFKANRSSQKP